MTTLTIAEARNNLADAINRVSYGGERVIFSRRGKSVAALVSFQDLEWLQKMEDAEDIRTARKALRDYEHDQSGAITLNEYVRTRSTRK
jgi:prevent-host-death family protein